MKEEKKSHKNGKQKNKKTTEQNKNDDKNKQKSGQKSKVSAEMEQRRQELRDILRTINKNQHNDHYELRALLDAKLDPLSILEEKLEYLSSLDNKLEGLSSLDSKLEKLSSLETQLKNLSSIDEKLTYLSSLDERLEYLSSLDSKLEQISSFEVQLNKLSSIDEKLTYLSSFEEKLGKIAALDERLGELTSIVKNFADNFDSKFEEELASLSGTIQLGMENVSDSVKSSPDKIVEKTDEMQRLLLEKIDSSIDGTSAGLSHIAEVFAKLEGSFKEEINALRETLQKVFEEMYMQFKDSSKGLVQLAILMEQYVGDFKEEREKFDSKMKKEEARRLNDIAVRNYYGGKIDAAIRQLKESVLLDEEAPETLTNLAVALSKKGMQKEARKIFERVLKINPDMIEAKVGLGMIMFDRGNVDEAIEIFKEASKKGEQEAFVYADLGYAYEQKEMIDKAVSNWEIALELDSTLKDVGEKLKLYKDKEA